MERHQGPILHEDDVTTTHSRWVLINNGSFIRFLTYPWWGNTQLVFCSCLKWGSIRSSWRKTEPEAEKMKGRHGNCLQVSEWGSYVWTRGWLTPSEPCRGEGSVFQVTESKDHGVGCFGRWWVPCAGRFKQRQNLSGVSHSDPCQSALCDHSCRGRVKAWSNLLSPWWGIIQDCPSLRRLNSLGCPPLMREPVSVWLMTLAHPKWPGPSPWLSHSPMSWLWPYEKDK